MIQMLRRYGVVGLAGLLMVIGVSGAALRSTAAPRKVSAEERTAATEVEVARQAREQASVKGMVAEQMRWTRDTFANVIKGRMEQHHTQQELAWNRKTLLRLRRDVRRMQARRR